MINEKELEERLEKAVKRYAKKDLSLGKVAEVYDVPRLELVYGLEHRNYKFMDGITREEARESILKAIERHRPRHNAERTTDRLPVHEDSEPMIEAIRRRARGRRPISEDQFWEAVESQRPTRNQ